METVSHFKWLLVASGLIGFGIGHEILIYWIQWRFQFYTRIFQQNQNLAFWAHGVELGGIWLLVGSLLAYWLFQIPESTFHQSQILEIVGWLGAFSGAAIMLCGLYSLGWSRMMKGRLFQQTEPDWVTSGIYQWIPHPMYSGSQVTMFFLMFALDSWLILFCVLVMMILQFFQIQLENKPCR